MGPPPEIVRGQGHNTDDSADPIACQTAVEERPVAAIVLDHEEADEEARSGHSQQQADPIAVGDRRPTSRPRWQKGHGRDPQLENAARAIWLAIMREQGAKARASGWPLDHI